MWKVNGNDIEKQKKKVNAMSKFINKNRWNNRSNLLIKASLEARSQESRHFNDRFK